MAFDPNFEYSTPIAQALHEHYLSLWVKPTEERIARLKAINTPSAIMETIVNVPRTTSEQDVICYTVQQIEQATDPKAKLRLQAALRRKGVRWSELVEKYGSAIKEA